jgi:CRP/FNR family transcriptional regulator, cyclic AMP receptor protein
VSSDTSNPAALPSAQGTRAPAFNPDVFLSTPGPGRTMLRFSKKKIIFPQAGPADAVFYIHSGMVRLSVTSGSGKEATLGVVGPGEFIGEYAIHPDHTRRLTSAVTLTDCLVLRLERNEMLRALRENPGFAELFILRLLSRNARVQADLADQLFSSTEKRLARALLLLAQQGKGAPEERIVPKISQETLAEMIGTTRSRVNMFMNRFRKLGYLRYDGKLTLHDSLLQVLTKH